MIHRRCPVCASNNIALDMGGQSGKYVCGNCGYVGVLIIEEDDEPPPFGLTTFAL